MIGEIYLSGAAATVAWLLLEELRHGEELPQDLFTKIWIMWPLSFPLAIYFTLKYKRGIFERG